MCVKLSNLLNNFHKNNKIKNNKIKNKTNLKTNILGLKKIYSKNTTILKLDSDKIFIDNNNTSTIFYYLYNINRNIIL
tara:strand:+ start:274 stop:507 length:234 start_codon:yes stop_codon:yes gene_type:complete